MCSNSKFLSNYLAFCCLFISSFAQAETISVAFDETDTFALREAIFVPFLQVGQIATAENHLDVDTNKLPETLPSHWQVVVVNHETLLNECKPNGKLETIDWKNIPHKDLLLPQALETCGLGYSITGTTLGYSIAHKYGTPPSTWEDLFDLKRYPGKRALPRHARNNFEIALMADNVKTDQVYAQLETKEGVQRAINKLKNIESDIIWYDNPFQLQAWLLSGDIAMAVAYDGLLLQGEGSDNVGVIRDQVIYRMRYLAIPKESSNKMHSYALLSFATQPTQQKKYVENQPYGMILRQSDLLLSPELQVKMTTEPQNLKHALFENYEFYVKHGDEIEAEFQKWVAKDIPKTITLQMNSTPDEKAPEVVSNSSSDSHENATQADQKAEPKQDESALVLNPACDKPFNTFIAKPSKVGIAAMAKIDAHECWATIHANKDLLTKVIDATVKGNQATALYLASHLNLLNAENSALAIQTLGRFSDKNMESLLMIVSKGTLTDAQLKTLIVTVSDNLKDDKAGQIKLLKTRKGRLSKINKQALKSHKTEAVNALDAKIAELENANNVHAEPKKDESQQPIPSQKNEQATTSTSSDQKPKNEANVNERHELPNVKVEPKETGTSNERAQ